MSNDFSKPIAFYRQPDGDGVVLVDDKGNRQAARVDLLTLTSEVGEMIEVQPPPPGAGWRIGDAGQWRRDPVRKFAWGREGQHFALGLLLAIVSASGIIFEELHIAYGLAIGAQVKIGFIVYEISEGWRIRDQAYRDIGPAFVGYLVGGIIVIAGLVVYGLLT